MFCSLRLEVLRNCLFSIFFVDMCHICENIYKVSVILFKIDQIFYLAFITLHIIFLNGASIINKYRFFSLSTLQLVFISSFLSISFRAITSKNITPYKIVFSTFLHTCLLSRFVIFLYTKSNHIAKLYAVLLLLTLWATCHQIYFGDEVSEKNLLLPKSKMT